MTTRTEPRPGRPPARTPRSRPPCPVLVRTCELTSFATPWEASDPPCSPIRCRRVDGRRTDRSSRFVAGHRLRSLIRGRTGRCTDRMARLAMGSGAAQPHPGHDRALAGPVGRCIDHPAQDAAPRGARSGRHSTRTRRSSAGVGMLAAPGQPLGCLPCRARHLVACHAGPTA